MIDITNLSKTYNYKKSNQYQALFDIDLHIEEGEMAAIVGASGAGKSTLLHILACIDNYERGEYYLDGELVRNGSEKSIARVRNEKIGMVMQDFANKRTNKLSGGQKQRVAIARAIVNNPSIILADEPTGALDSRNSEEIMNLFKSLNEQGKTIVIVTHDSKVAEQCNRIIEISDGSIVK